MSKKVRNLYPMTIWNSLGNKSVNALPIDWYMDYYYYCYHYCYYYIYIHQLCTCFFTFLFEDSAVFNKKKIKKKMFLLLLKGLLCNQTYPTFGEAKRQHLVLFSEK